MAVRLSNRCNGLSAGVIVRRTAAWPGAVPPASFVLVRHRPSVDPPWLKLLALRRLGYFSAALGKEVGFSMVRKSPFSSWTRGASITPTGAKGR
jgi:hypothetical protein